MSDIFEEVDEEVRKDRFSELWKKYGIFAWLAMAAIVAATGINEYMKYSNQKAAAARVLVLEDAVETLKTGDYAAAETQLSALASAKNKAAPLAANLLARVRLECAGDAEGAAQALLATASDTGAPYQKLALLKAAYLRADTASLEELRGLLGALNNDEGPIGTMARELLAAKTYAEGDIASARTQFNRLKFEPNAPQGVTQRAELALAAMPRITEADPADPAPAEPTETNGEADTPAAAPETAQETTEETGQ